MLQFALGLIHLGRSDPRVEAQQSLPKIPDQQDLLVTFAAKATVSAKFLRVIGKGDLPAQLIFEQVTGAFLYKYVFGIVVAHGVTSCTSILELIIYQISIWAKQI